MNTIISKIDITPLVGVALILVIVFMVTSPLMMSSANLDINLPKATTIDARSQTNITISYSKDQKLALNEMKVNIKLIGHALKNLIKTYPDRLVIIRADKDVTQKRVVLRKG